MQFKTIAAEEMEGNAIKKIGKEWALLTAVRDGKTNTMTISWGGMGVLWNKPVAFVFVRPERYTYQFIDGAEEFTLSFFDDSYKDKLVYLGTVSGKDEDKIAKAGLTPHMEAGTAYFEEAQTVIKCKTLYRQDLETAHATGATMPAFYHGEGLHRMYIGEIESVLVAE